MISTSIIGIDLGGTKTAIALIDALTKEVRKIEVFPTRSERGFSAVLEQLTEATQALRASDTVAIGLGVPGLVDRTTERVVTMPNIPGSDGSDPRGLLAKATGLPVTIDNDARCFAYAEAILGAGKGEKIVVGITLGTGVGGGIVIDGKLFHGSRGFAGEFGHMLLVPGSPPYEAKDMRGDVEQFLSGTAMGKRCTEAKRPEDYLEGAVCGFMQPKVFREVAWLITNLVHAIDPSVIIFGGSAGRALKPHFPDIEKELKLWLLPGTPHPRLAVGALKDAAVIGAALRVEQCSV